MILSLGPRQDSVNSVQKSKKKHGLDRIRCIIKSYLLITRFGLNSRESLDLQNYEIDHDLTQLSYH